MIYININKNTYFYQKQRVCALYLAIRIKGKRIGSRLTLVLMVAILGALTGCGTLSQRQDGLNQNELAASSFTFQDGGQALYYSFNLGTPSNDSPIIFFVSGSGCASVKKRFPDFFNPIKGQLDARVFVLQKRGIEETSSESNCSQAFRTTDYFNITVADQMEFINRQLISQKQAMKVVVLMGASEGAIVASKVASKDARVTHLALISGGGSTLRENLKFISQKTWYFTAPDKAFLEIAADPKNTEKSSWGHSYKYWSTILDVNIGDILLSLDIPIVMAMGELDESVPIETAYALKQRFSSQGKNNLNLFIFPDSDHRLYDKRRNTSRVKEFLDGLVFNIKRGKYQ